MVIRALDAAGLRARAGELRDLLADAVAGNASMGFMLPRDDAALERFWSDIADDVAAGLRTCLVAIEEGRIVGSVQLAPCDKANQPHRADVQKLLVRTTQRRRGIGLALMQAVEREALAAGRVLLTLDTRSGSAADTHYRRWGWTTVGIVPDYAYDPDGTPGDCTFYFKQLALTPPFDGRRPPGTPEKTT